MPNYNKGKVEVWYGDVPLAGSNGLWLKPGVGDEPPSLSKYNNSQDSWVPLVDQVDLSALNAAEIVFVPTTPANWNGGVDPGSTGAAIDQLAARVKLNDAKVSNAAHTGAVTGSTELSITDKAVTLAKMADLATTTILGRKTVGSGAPEALSASDAGIVLGLSNYLPVSKRWELGASTAIPTITTSPFTPEFTNAVYKADLNITGNSAISWIVGTTPNFPTSDSCTTVYLKNVDTATRTIALHTADCVHNGITYSFNDITGGTISVAALKVLEISYLFVFSSATDCRVNIITKIQA